MSRSNLLFLTNFSEACFQAIPTVAEWIDSEGGDLTLLHVHKGRRTQEHDAHQKLKSFFAEADRYARAERVLVSGNPTEVIPDVCAQLRPTMVFAPASEQSGLPRPLHRSLRADLVRSSGIRLWTRGRKKKLVFGRGPSNVAYVVTGHPDWPDEAYVAAVTAVRYQARFHMIYLTPVQEVHDGILAADLSIECPGAPLAQLREVVNSLPIRPVIHSSTGNEMNELPRLLDEANADSVFVGEKHAFRRTLRGYRVHEAIDSRGCDVICFPQTPVTKENRPHAVTEAELVRRPIYLR